MTTLRLGILIAAALAAAPARMAAQSAAVRLGVTVAPETVTVGDRFQVRLRVRAPAGADVTFPAGPDSLSGVEAVDPRRVNTAADSGAVDETAVYTLVAWDVGARRLGLGDAVVAVAGQEQRVPLGDVQVFVRSVLPADSAQRLPKPPRALVEPPAPWWWPWLPILVAALALLALLWWLLRRRRRAGPVLQEDPYVAAEREFARVEALRLLEAGERGRYVALMVEVLRDYLARRIGGAHLSLTSAELLAAMRDAPGVPLDGLQPVLEEADLIKFARGPVSTERARALAREARAIVRAVDDRVKARAVPAPAAAAA
ncbi:MAG TPA: hypothetical protein VNA89_16500 [Gemmatimonadaceae bacterium]|nr:hypothetical protein [Gemmatimonadaceae bacterium]